MSFLKREEKLALAQEQAKRIVKSPGGECSDVFGTDGNGSIVFPSTNSQLQQQPHHRITKPPGGETSDIFTTTPTSTPPTTPRKVKNYMASTIFTPETQAADQQKIRHRPDDGSFQRLFGASDSAQTSPHHQANGHGDATDGQLTPRGKNHQKSNVLFAENGKANGHGNGVGNGHGNGIGNGHGNGVGNGHGNGVGNGHGNGVGNGHGNGHAENGGSSGSSSGSATPVGNGHTNGKSNGHSNGGSHDGSPNGGTPGKRIPPGGFSSKLW